MSRKDIQPFPDGKVGLGLEPNAYLKKHYKTTLPCNYIMLMEGGVHLLQEKVKSVAAHSLLLKLAEDMELWTGNTCYVHIGALAEYYGVTPGAIYKQFGYLLKGDIFRRVKKGQYLVNPWILYTGYPHDWEKAVRRWDAGVTE